MAATIPCSEAWLRRLFLRYTGKTPKEYYLDARLDLALSLLKQQETRLAKSLIRSTSSTPFISAKPLNINLVMRRQPC